MCRVPRCWRCLRNVARQRSCRYQHQRDTTSARGHTRGARAFVRDYDTTAKLTTAKVLGS
jgi:hypothetical protein